VQWQQPQRHQRRSPSPRFRPTLTHASHYGR
jgi:hypothetical protein